MHPDDVLTGPVRLGYFRAPANRTRVSPVRIPDDREYAELILQGGVFFEQPDGTERYCTAGSLFWHLPGEFTVCRYKPGKPYECLAASFPVCAPHRRIAPRLTFLRNPAEALAIAQDFLHAFHQESFDMMLLTKALHARLMWEACCSQQEKPRTGALPRVLEKALDWMDSFYAEPLSVPQLAERLGVSAPQLYKLFRKHTGESPHKHLQARRLQEARTRLALTSVSLKVLAAECGFPSVEHFCRLFKARYGMTPMEYRARSEVRTSGNPD